MENNREGLLHRYFAGLAEDTFESQLGLVDPPLVDYVTDLLVRFVRSDGVFRLRSLAGRPLIEIVDMMREADQRIGEARREVYRHIGDFTLFWTGVYPERVSALNVVQSIDHLVDYREHGKRSYRMASQIQQHDEQEASSDLLQRLSEQYELCAYGLRQVREQWETRAGEGDGPQMLLWN